MYNTNFIQFLKYIITTSHYITILILFTMVILISWKTSSPTMPQLILPPPHPFPQIILKFLWQVLTSIVTENKAFSINGHKWHIHILTLGFADSWSWAAFYFLLYLSSPQHLNYLLLPIHIYLYYIKFILTLLQFFDVVIHLFTYMCKV